MKKINFGLLIGIVLLTGKLSHAQNTNNPNIIERNSSEYLKAAEEKPGILLNDINMHAIRHFNIFFQNPLNVKWEKIPEGYVVHFISNGINKMVAYTNRGTWVHTLSYYDEFKLPPYVRHFVKSVYYDFIINQVIQIEEDSQLIYMVQMENTTSLKTIMVCDEGIKIIKDIQKWK